MLMEFLATSERYIVLKVFMRFRNLKLTNQIAMFCLAIIQIYKTGRTDIRPIIQIIILRLDEYS